MVRSKCEDDSLKFIIKNSGTGNMNSIADYIVVEDAVMLLQAPLPQLNVGDSITLSYPANGSTWYIQVDQEAYHPYPTPVALAVEGCSTSGVFSTGFVNQFPLNDTPPSVDIDCTANTGSFDPNDKQGFPNGYGDAHDIVPGTALEYLIRFQNTGTDTAFTVQVVDTLSSWLDPATIQFGVSSHPYRYDLNGEGIVHFIFENILLPDSNINAAASNGFVKFSIKPRADVPLKSVIENTAAIYFDFNDPVFTNTTYHRINEKFINVAAWEPKTAAASIEVVPNPFHQETILTVKGLRQHSDLQLQVFDLQGNVLKTIDSTTDNFRLVRTDWPSGAYHFCVRQQGKVIGSGTLLVQ